MSPSGPENKALAVLGLARGGRFTEIRELFTEGLRPMIIAAALQAAWDAELTKHGPVTSIGTPTIATATGDAVVVKVPVIFHDGELTLAVHLTGAGQLTDLQLIPPSDAHPATPWQPPAYANPDSFDEHDVTLGSGPLAVPGTLSLPNEFGQLPAVVMLSGSGPVDRDTTIGPNKPLKDLAWGLATRGVAVLRFDKVTYAHPHDVKNNRAFTVANEYLPDALAGIRLLQTHAAIDPTRIFLVGHSLGGTIAPRIAAAEQSVAGLVILAGGTQPLQWAAVRQIRYLASLDPATNAAAQPGIDTMTAQARRVDSPDLSPHTPDNELPFSMPAPYWLDLRSYDPVATAAALGKPILIAQGGRDYQATVTDDLNRWRAGLDQRPGVTIRIYPMDNHFFFPGTGPSTPAELARTQHTDPALITDIDDWIKSSTPR